MTLALAYAERFPERVSEMILLSITMTRRTDVRWLAHETGGSSRRRGRGSGGAVPEERDGDLVAAYDRLLNGSADPAVRVQASLDWVAWEDAILSLEEGYVVPHPRWADEPYLVASRAWSRTTSRTPPGSRRMSCWRTRIAWPGSRACSSTAASTSGPPDVAWQLARAWPGSELTFIPGGHTGDEEMDRLLLDATARFADRR